MQLRHCMFNWTLALPRTEMHRVGICRSSKDHIRRTLLLLLSSRLTCSSGGTALYSRFCATENKHENSNSGLRDLSYSLHNRRSVNHAASCLQDLAGRQVGCFRRGSGGNPNFDNSQTRTHHGWAKLLHPWARLARAKRAAQKGTDGVRGRHVVSDVKTDSGAPQQ